MRAPSARRDAPHAKPGPTGASAGFTLLELIVVIFIIGIGLLSVAPLFVHARRQSASSGDLGGAGALATRRQELLRAASFTSLTPGGSLNTNVTGYSDLSQQGYAVRWTIANDASPVTRKTITVRAIRTRAVAGPAKDVLLTTLRAR